MARATYRYVYYTTTEETKDPDTGETVESTVEKGLNTTDEKTGKSFKFTEICTVNKVHYIWSDDDPITQDEENEFAVSEVPQEYRNSYRLERANQVKDAYVNILNYSCSSVYIKSSLGFTVGADQAHQADMNTSLEVLEDGSSIRFKLYDGSYANIKKEQFGTLVEECTKNGKYLYEQEQQMLKDIAACKTYVDLLNFSGNFVMHDFTKD